VQRDKWWDNASAEDIGDAWQTANACRDVDSLEAAVARTRLLTPITSEWWSPPAPA